MNLITRKIAVVVLIFLVLIGTFFTFKWWLGSKNVRALTFIPQSAVAVLELNSPLIKFDELKQKSFWPLYSLSNHGKDLDKTVADLQKLLMLDENQTSLFQDKQVFISAHILQHKQVDYLFVAPISGSTDKDLIGAATESLKANSAVRYQNREFENQSIHEFTDKMTKLTFSYMVYKNFIIGSFSGILVEDAIRTINKGEKKSFFALLKNDETKEEKTDKNVRLYVNYQQVNSYFKFLFDDQNAKQFSFISNLATYSDLTYQPNEKSLVFTGTSSVNGKSGMSFLNVFKFQNPTVSKVQNFIPTQSASVYYWGFESGKLMRTSLNEYWIANNLPIAWQSFNQKHHIDISNYYNWFGKELALVTLNTQSNGEANKVLFLHTKDIVRASEDLSLLMRAIGGEEQTLHVGNNAISVKKIKESNFPAKLLGHHFGGFSATYVSTIQDYIIISNHPDNIVAIYEAYQSENVWGRNPQWSKMLLNATSGSNLALVLNSNQAWDHFSNLLFEDKKEQLPSFEKQLKAFDAISLKFTSIGDKYKTTLSLGYQNQQVNLVVKDTAVSNKEEIALESNIKEVQKFAIGSILNQPILNTININENNTDYFFQDATNQLYAYSNTHEKLFIKPLDSKIVTRIFALDFNHFAFATTGKLYIITRKGEDFNLFPISLSNGNTIASLSVFDYEKKRDYRLFVSDSKGNLHLYNKKGEVPSTWKSINFRSTFIENPKHAAIENKDVIYFSLANNQIQVVNRKGENYPGFPFTMSSKSKSVSVIEKGTSLETSIIRNVTLDGKFYMVNLLGKKLLEQQLIKPNKNTTFQILSAENQSSHWLIERNEENKITLLDMNFKEIQSFDVPNCKKAVVKYYYIANDEIYYMIFNEGYTYLYDIKGKLLDSSALQTSAMPLLKEYHDEILLICPETNSISVKKF